MAQSATDHAHNILSAIIPGRRDLLDKALRHLTPAHFQDVTQRNLFSMLEVYADKTGAVVTRAAVDDWLSRIGFDAGSIALYLETYDLLSDNQVAESDFLWSLDQIRELAAERATAEALTQAMEVLRSGAKSDRGQELRGHADARTHVLTSFAQIDRELSMQESPEGDIRLEKDDFLAEYQERKKQRESGTKTGVFFGISVLDELIGGLQPGELDLMVGYTSAGKSSLCVQLAWHAAVMQGLNVVYATTETLRPQVRRKLISRHARHTMFGMPSGIELNTRDLKAGSLPESAEERLQAIVEDFSGNPTYGKLNVIQMPRGSGIGVLESRITRIARSMHVDLLVMDYLQLLKPENRRNSDREELGSILRDAKVLATTFQDGVGVPLVSPWQVSRAAHVEALKEGHYTASATAETAEASNTPDVIISILEPTIKTRYVELNAQILKNRDGVTADGLTVHADYATSFFSTESAAPDSSAALLDL